MAIAAASALAIKAQSKRLQSFGLGGECGTVNACLNLSGWLGVRGQPEASRYVPAELATKCPKQFFHKFLLNDTFAPAERFNPKLALGTVGNVPGGLAGAISFS
jgi:hypothetical protein